jgi:bacillithiol system protein YtxJ
MRFFERKSSSVSKLKTCKTREDFKSLLKNSESKPVFLLKHSTACFASTRALKEALEKIKNGEQEIG